MDQCPGQEHSLDAACVEVSTSERTRFSTLFHFRFLVTFSWSSAEIDAVWASGAEHDKPVVCEDHSLTQSPEESSLVGCFANVHVDWGPT